MPHAEDMVRAYRNGDAEERMDIYLSHPGLRSRFDEIERDGSHKVPPGDVPSGEKRSWHFGRQFAVGRRTGRL